MKNQPDLSELTNEELNKRAKTAKVVTGMLSGIVLIQFAAGIYLTVQKGFNVFTIIPVAFLPLLAVNYYNVKKINDEVARRKG